MTNYLDTVDIYDSSVIEVDEYDPGQWVHDPVRQVQKRVIVVLCLVLMVSSSLVLLAVPRNIGIGSGGTQTSNSVSSQAGEQVQQQVIAPAQVTNGKEIAVFFTPEVQYWANDIARWSAEHDVDPNAAATIMQIESCGNPQAVSIAGARGLFQVMPFHFTSNENMMDPDTNAFRGLNFLVEQLRYTGGDMELSFAGYNGGYAASGGDYANWPNETQRYYQWAKGIYADAQSGASSSETLQAWLDAGGGPGCQLAAAQLGL